MIGGYAAAAFLAAGLAVLGPPVAAQGEDISGVVTSAAGPEAGVWVIAETQDFDTGFRKIVVTDDAGRFLVPDLPDAAYEVWVRGYGLADSEKTPARPGDDLALTAIAAASPREAAQLYPANYWYSLLEVPPASDFPGTGPRGNGIGVAMRTQADWSTGSRTAASSAISSATGRRARCRCSISTSSTRPPTRGSTASGPAGQDLRWRSRSIGWVGREPCSCTPTGAIGSPPASCRPFRRVPRAGSATSSSACGSGAIRAAWSTTRSRPTSATRR